MKKLIYLLVGGFLALGVLTTALVAEYLYGDISYLLGYPAPQYEIQAPASSPPVSSTSLNDSEEGFMLPDEFVAQQKQLTDYTDHNGKSFRLTGPLTKVEDNSLFLESVHNIPQHRTLSTHSNHTLEFTFPGNPKLKQHYQIGQRVSIEATLYKVWLSHHQVTYEFGSAKIVSAY